MSPRAHDLVIVGYGYNDAGAYSPGEFEAAYRTLISNFRSLGYTGPILLLGMPAPASDVTSTWRDPIWANYLEGMEAIARDVLGVTFVDVSARIPSCCSGGVWADGVHLNAAGLDRLAAALLEVVGPGVTG